MNNFSYMDTIQAAFSSCLPRFSRAKPIDSNDNNNAHNNNTRTQRSPSSELEGLLYDTDTEAETLSLHSNIGTGRRKHRKRPAFSLTLFGYTLFGRPPIYLENDEDGDEDGDGDGDGDGRGWRRRRGLGAISSSTLDSDAAPLDALTIARLSSPDRTETVQQRREEEEARRKAERKARRRERREGERMSMLLSLNGGSHGEGDDFEGFQGSGDTALPSQPAAGSGSFVSSQEEGPVTGEEGGACSEEDGDDADLGGELYTRKKKRASSAVWSGSGSDSRSRTSASITNGGDPSLLHHQLARIATAAAAVVVQPQPQPPSYPQTEMQLPNLVKTKKHGQGTSRRFSPLSSSTASQSTAPYTPTQSVLSESPAVAAFPIPHERMEHNNAKEEDARRFPSVGLSGPRGKTRDMGAFLAIREGDQS